MSYLQDAEYKEALKLFQSAEWNACLEILEGVLERYPDEIDLKQFVDDVSTRREVSRRGDNFEKIIDEQAGRRRWTWGLVFFVVFFLAAAAYFGLGTTQEYFASLRLKNIENAQKQELSLQLENAEGLLQAGRPEDALVILHEIEEMDSMFLGVSDLIAIAEVDVLLADDYELAVSLHEAGKLEEALAGLMAIQVQNQHYRDVDRRIERITGVLNYYDLITRADVAFESDNWAEAVELYESILDYGLEEGRDEVKDRLYESYLQRVMDMLNEPELLIDEIDLAASYYLKSRSLKPQNQESQRERLALRKAVFNLLVSKYILLAENLVHETDDLENDLVRAEFLLKKALNLDPDSFKAQAALEDLTLFNQAVIDFVDGAYEEALPNLEKTYNRDPFYGGGLLTFLLHESYTAYATTIMADGIYDEALGHFQQAEAMALKGDPLGVRLFEAQLNVAMMLGKLALFQDAGTKYTSIIEDFSIMEKAEASDEDLYNQLVVGVGLLDEGNYREAYLQFYETFGDVRAIYSYQSWLANSGDNLIFFAFEREVTLKTLRLVNGLAVDAFYIEDDMEILLPYFEE